MENVGQTPPRQPNPRRRKRDPKRVFFEAYFPVLIAAAVLVVIIAVIVINSINSKEQKEQSRKESIAAQQQEDARQSARRKEAEACMAKAKAAAATYDFQAAIDILDGFGSDIFDYDDMLQLRDSYKHTMENLVEFTPEQVVNLSVQLLIADAQRAFVDPNYGGGYKKNFITTREFSNLLTQLYNNGYVLVDMDDLVSELTGDGFTTYTAKTVSLPQGKKPLMLTQTQVNYYTYMVDPDGDGIADKNGAGFASKLILENGELKNELVTADGQTVTGNYDLVPILEDFLKEHPDFSYHGARPILAVTGYNGIFGYRNTTLPEVAPVLDELRSRGYTIAFYTYANADYNASTVAEISKEIQRWNENIVPVLGSTDMLVYARSADIAAPGTYSGEKFNTLHGSGFRYYLGFCTNGEPWFVADSTYVRQGRIMVSAANLTNCPKWFEGICDPSAVLVEVR